MYIYIYIDILHIHICGERERQRERAERLRCVFKSIPQSSSIFLKDTVTQNVAESLKSFTKGALQRFVPTTSVGVKDPSFETRLPTMTPQIICVTSVMSSLISSAKWSQRSCSYPIYPDDGHPTPLPGSRPLLDWSH